MKILILLVLPQIFRSSYDRILKMKEYFNEPTELKFSKVIQNDIGKEMDI